jgi:hypothetical protein
MPVEKISVELEHINEKLGELLDEVAALLIWNLQFCDQNHIYNEALGHHIKRIYALIEEITHPPSLRFALPDAFIQTKPSNDKRPPENATVYPMGGGVCNFVGNQCYSEANTLDD